MRWARALVLLSAGGLWLVPAPAKADAASEAELHYSLGLELYKQRRYEEALPHLIASNRLAPNANVVFDVAQTYGLLRRDADAFNWYQAYLDFSTLDQVGRERGTKAQAALAPRVAVLDVSSSPAGAELFLDRVELGSVGKAPRKVAVAPGARTVIAQLPGHHQAQAVVSATLGAVVPVSVELSPVVGVLVVESQPSGATVRRQESAEVLGVTPLKLDLPVGEVRLTVEHDGYVEQQRVATVREQAETRVTVELTAAASTVAVLSVSGEPEGARVRLSGRELGTVPLVVQGLTPGTAQLEVASAGLEPWRSGIALEPGAATRVQVQLVAPESTRRRGLRWLGYGAGGASVIAGVAVGLVAISNRSTFYGAPTKAGYDLVLRENAAADLLVLGGLLLEVGTFLADRWIWPVAHSRGQVELSR